MALALVEQKLAQLCQRENAVLTRSGSMAIIAALHSAKLPPGSKVIIPASMCPIVLFAIQIAGFDVKIADVSLTSLSMEVEQISAVYDNSVSAIIAVHGYGRCCGIEAIERFAKDRNIALIEDACLAYGSSVNGRAVGSFGDYSVVSFGYDKPINLGYGGAVLVNEAEKQNALLAFLNNNEISVFNNCDLAEKLVMEMEYLPKYVEQRLKNVKYLTQNITNKGFVKLPYQQEYAYWRYPLLCNQRGEFLSFAKQQGVLFTTHYKSLSELQTSTQCPNAEQIGNKIINLFVRPQTPQQQLEKMVSCINEFQTS
ncbi:DegT/DnrJ/EryC1/StrS family aminotransferase [Pseudoalteromonas sp. SSM20]|uniref:DegT/DnrJ/EryC1/StrS family aminotransferase n=1 Tax=Pseudoalteromonas sp. SSM20 TaxID=3139394 RepID=UPI003BAD52D1